MPSDEKVAEYVKLAVLCSGDLNKEADRLRRALQDGGLSLRQSDRIVRSATALSLAVATVTLAMGTADDATSEVCSLANDIEQVALGWFRQHLRSEAGQQ